MLVVSAFSYAPTFQGDGTPAPHSNAELAVMWLDWCAELGAVDAHRLVLLGPYGFELPASVKAWSSYEYIADRRNVVGWPQGPNAMLEQAGWHLALHKNKDPWLWCEPDCIPLRPSWLSEIEREYYDVALAAGKPFMGFIVESGPHYPKHMTGNGVYPHNFHALAPRLMDRKVPGVAFDIKAAAQIVPLAYHSPLFCHQYRCGRVPSFAQFRAIVPEGACLFHSDKYGRTIELLRAKRDGKLAEVDPFVPVETHPVEKISTTVTLESICTLVRDHITSEGDRQRFMNFLREGKYNMPNFGKKRAAEEAPLAAV